MCTACSTALVPRSRGVQSGSSRRCQHKLPQFSSRVRRVTLPPLRQLGERCLCTHSPTTMCHNFPFLRLHLSFSSSVWSPTMSRMFVTSEMSATVPASALWKSSWRKLEIIISGSRVGERRPCAATEQVLKRLEGTARCADFLLAPAEGFGLQQRLFCSCSCRNF